MPLDPTLEESRRRIQAAYDPRLLHASGLRLVDLLSRHLDGAEQSAHPVLPWRPPPEQTQAASAMLDQSCPDPVDPDALTERFAALASEMLRRGLNLHDPRYIGHQVAASVPVAGWFDAVGSVTNQVMAIYEMGPWATAAERALVDRLGERIGWESGRFSGLITHGGSLANFTALLTARNVVLDHVWEKGMGGSQPSPVLVVHQDAHYCVTRSAGMLGLGTDQVVRVPLDSRRRMDPDRLDQQLSRLRQRNVPVVAVVACACATPIGAFDPLDAIADVCARHEVWLHVDAAHGGAVCFSRRQRHLVEGLDRCDSLIWDAHKMLFVPGLCAFVFYRDAAHKFEAFRQEAPYLFDPSAPGLADYDSGLRTVECTKRAASFGLWGLWAMFGPQLFEDLVDVTFDLAQVLYGKLAEAEDFVPVHRPECNIVVFRHVPPQLRDASPERLGRFQLELRRQVIESGEFYIVSTNLDGQGAVRVTVINPLTSESHLDALLDSLRSAGKRLLAAG